MNLRNSFFILFCLCSLTANAITIGRNGGGLPEMQVVSYTNDIQQYLKACLQLGSNCNLSAEYFALVKKASTRLENQRVKVTYSFNMKEPFIWSVSGDAVTFNQAYLYQKNGSGKTDVDILRLSFAATLFFELGQSPTELPRLIDTIQNWKLPFASQRTNLVLTELNGLVHIISLADKNLHDSVLIEAEKGSIDLGPLLTQKLVSNLWKLKAATWDSLYLILTVEYFQSGNVWRADVVFVLASDKTKGLITVSKVRLMNVVEVGAAANSRDIVWPTRQIE